MFNFFKSKRKIIEMLENANRKIFDECVYLRNKNHELTQEIQRMKSEAAKKAMITQQNIITKSLNQNKKFIAKKKKRK